MNRSSQLSNSVSHCLPAANGAEPAWCFARVLEQLDDALIVADILAASIIFCNQAAKDILATLGLETGYRPLIDFLAARNIRFAAETTEGGPHTLIHNDRIIEVSALRLGDVNICLKIRDITEKKRLESLAQTVNTMDNLGFIFSGIRHEIGNPLNSIKMTNSVLRKNLDRFSREDISRYVDRTTSEISRMEYLLKSLKNFSMYEKADCAPHDLRDFLETHLGLIEPDLEKKSIAVSCRYPESNCAVLIDPRALHQAILNIITNAADAVAGQSDARIDISTCANGRLAWIRIDDNGCGMTPEQLEMLFQPFHTSKPHGNGLGLVITQKLLTVMHATLEIQSNPGRGTTARIGLPLAEPADKRQP